MHKLCSNRHCPYSRTPIANLRLNTCPRCDAWLTVELDPGDHIGGFRVVDKLPEGDGGMATVYRAAHPDLKENVALKLCHDKPYEFEALKREAEALAALQHPNIVRIVQMPSRERLNDPFVPKTYVGGEPRCFIAMEFVDGVSLRQRMSTSQRLRWSEVVHILRDVSAGLDYAHDKGFLHLDVKPSNILLDAHSRRAVLTDFGLVRPTDTGSTNHKTGKRTLGTAGYMSPEQVAQKSVDHRSDIFSLGVVTYEMLTGIAPFTRKSTSDTLDAVRHEDPIPPRRHNAKLPLAADAAVMRALSKEPAQRPASAAGLCDEIAGALRQHRGLFG